MRYGPYISLQPVRKTSAISVLYDSSCVSPHPLPRTAPAWHQSTANDYIKKFSLELFFQKCMILPARVSVLFPVASCLPALSAIYHSEAFQK